MSKVSVVVPVYNVQDYVAKCLDCLCQQTYQDMEIICVDDCSSDNTLNILKTYAEKDKRVRIIKRDANGGQAAARQTGIDVTTGAYIGFVDSDDWVDLDYFEKMVIEAERTHADIIVNSNILMHEKGQVFPKIFPGHKQLEMKVYDNPVAQMEKVWCVVWNKLFRADFLKQRQFTIPKRSAHEDVFFHYATFAFAKSMSFFCGSAYHYLYRESSISHVKYDWGVEHLKVYDQIYDFYQANNLLNKKIKLYATMPMFNINNEQDFALYKGYFQKIKAYMDENAEVFNEADLFIAQCILSCPEYADYKAQYPANLMMCYLRRKK